MSPAGAGNDHCKECEKPVWFKKIGMCRSHGTKYYRQQMARKKNKKASRKKSPKAKRLFEQAKGLVLRHKRVSYDFLQQELKVGKQIAHELLQLLEDDGVIGPAVPRRSREILGVASQPTRRSSRTPSSRAKTHTRDKAGVLRQLAEFFGKDSETARVVHEIIADLDELRRLKEGIRKLGKE